MPLNRTHYCQLFILSTASLFSVFSFTPKCTHTTHLTYGKWGSHSTSLYVLVHLYTVSLSHPYRDRSDFERGMLREGVLREVGGRASRMQKGTGEGKGKWPIVWSQKISPYQDDTLVLPVQGMHVSSVAQSCLTLCNPMDCSPPGFSVHGIFQARILKWVAIAYSRGSSWNMGQTLISCVSCCSRRILYHWAI